MEKITPTPWPETWYGVYTFFFDPPQDPSQPLSRSEVAGAERGRLFGSWGPMRQAVGIWPGEVESAG